MAGLAEAGAEVPVIGWIFRVWLKLPQPARQLVFLFLLYPLLAFFWLVTLLQLLGAWFNMEPLQRYALRGLGIDTNNLVATSSVIDTVSVTSFDSDVSKTLDPVFVRRGQGVAFLALVMDQGLRQYPACLNALAGARTEGSEIGTLQVSAGTGFMKNIHVVYDGDRQAWEIIGPKDWREDKGLKDLSPNDDIKINIKYIRSDVYNFPPTAKTINEFTPGSDAAADPFSACEKYKITLNVRLAKPELSIGHFN